jgi:hypothetical protein
MRMDGSKIPPHWRNPDAYTHEQRRHILATAADTLMTALATRHAQRQAT